MPIIMGRNICARAGGRWHLCPSPYWNGKGAKKKRARQGANGERVLGKKQTLANLSHTWPRRLTLLRWYLDDVVSWIPPGHTMASHPLAILRTEYTVIPPPYLSPPHVTLYLTVMVTFDTYGKTSTCPTQNNYGGGGRPRATGRRGRKGMIFPCRGGEGRVYVPGSKAGSIAIGNMMMSQERGGGRGRGRICHCKLASVIIRRQCPHAYLPTTAGGGGHSCG